jgi:EAL domain-containing protein (putative c-di-GMP-specific phosphodiesterase class I)
MPLALPMPTSASSKSESARLTALRDLEILDTPPEVCFDTITRLAAMYMQQESAFLVFVDDTRVWAKSNCRSKLADSPRQGSNAEKIVLTDKPLVLLGKHPDPSEMECKPQAAGLRFFAGVPIRTAGGHVAGALCVSGSRPRESVSAVEVRLLEHLADLVTDQLELRLLRSRAQALPSHPGNVDFGPESPTPSPKSSADNPWPQAEDFRNGLKLNQFVLYYQPEIELTTGRVVGLEALIRWQHPERGLVAPLEFIPQAEENSMILPLGDWGLAEACHQMQTWQREWSIPTTLRVCVNFSARQFTRAGLADHVQSTLFDSGLSAGQLGIEMTESSLNPNPAEAARVLGCLQDLGIALHLDDFGTGYSSLSYLHNFPFDVIKIDRSFVHRMNRGKQSFQIVKTILDLAGVLGMEVIAEGIETGEQMRLLRKMGCRYGQGFLFAPPLPAAKIEEFMSRAAIWTALGTDSWMDGGQDSLSPFSQPARC